MTVSSKRLARLIQDGNQSELMGVGIIPPPADLTKIESSGECAISLRLGRWFVSMKQANETFLDVIPTDDGEAKEARITKSHFVPFGEPFVVHPGRFVLGSTLEWVRLPTNISGYVGGKSRWGRRGIIIETAAGVHPGFSGCLTLEIANVGEVPVKLRPGMEICQLFLHDVVGDTIATETSLGCHRRPTLGRPKTDSILHKLSKSMR